MRLICENAVMNNDKLVLLAKNYNVLCEISVSERKILSAICIPGNSLYGHNLFSNMIVIGEKIVMIPWCEKCLFVYDYKSGSWEKIILNVDSMLDGAFLRYPIKYNNKLFIFGGYYPSVVIVNIESKEVEYYDSVFKGKNYNYKDPLFRGEPLINGKEVFLASSMDNSVLKFNMENLEYNWYEIAEKTKKYSGIVFWNGRYWLSTRTENLLVEWDGISEYTIHSFTDYVVDPVFCGLFKDGKDLLIVGVADKGTGIIRYKEDGNTEYTKEVLNFVKSIDDNDMVYQRGGTDIIYKNNGNENYYNSMLNETIVGRLVQQNITRKYFTYPLEESKEISLVTLIKGIVG